MKDRLKTLRNVLDLTLEDMALRLGVGQSTYNQWEYGYHAPNAKRIAQICTTFGVRRAWLVDGEGEMFEEPRGPELSQAVRTAAECIYSALRSSEKQAFLLGLSDFLTRSRALMQDVDVKPTKKNDATITIDALSEEKDD
ncbi:MAG: helix-turn-helix transcriptional regulator [Planctomycetia bacterium]|nr:helix-turn-helix transcriptional regulator [Planctomycetia bacterium]